MLDTKHHTPNQKITEMGRMYNNLILPVHEELLTNNEKQFRKKYINDS
jgi:hypothetical protein